MRYPQFAAALRRHGTIEQVQKLLGVTSRTQVIQYRLGRALPKAEKLLVHPDLLEAARRDIEASTPPPQQFVAA